MKKIVTVLLILLLLVGCSASVTKSFTATKKGLDVVLKNASGSYENSIEINKVNEFLYHLIMMKVTSN